MSEQKKYEMLLINSNPPLYIIKALRDIPEIGVRKGDKGGIIESEKNLSQEGSSWIEFDSMVRGFSRVENGYVGGKSTLSGNVILSRGTVLNSNIDGDMEIKGDIKIENSELVRNGRYYSSGIIRDSKLENCFFAKPFDIASTTIVAKHLFYGYDEVKMTGVKMFVESADMHKKMTIKQCTIETPTFYSNERLRMEHVNVRMDKDFFVRSKDVQKRSKSILIGKKNNPIRIIGESIHIHNSSIKGGSKLSGKIEIENSVIEGMNRIEMENGVIKKTKIRDFVTIKQINTEPYTINENTFEGDTVYICRKDEYVFGF
ncbi:hypothetical protein JMA_39130 (plasmid) [Jeotgalibacillus malaysiensis]|uniref:Uncharacterized protein n=1 Tax=Jeotgalibacillus malaysiensis TaxID=1508404 RepID=A0A0B5ASY5_9BACL|nr:hypothetical protein [Jeotgalibacillus malaysiensis]AJD93231.1 hypothetical protein JMA_39130 [Jeotgalibacillus malaysiensis]